MAETAGDAADGRVEVPAPQIGSLGLMIVGGYFLKIIAQICSEFPEEFYQNSFLLGSAFSNDKFVSGFLILLLPSLIFLRKTAWVKNAAELRLKLLVLAVSLLIAWQLSTLDYNFYFDQWHAADRILMLIFACAVWIHPVFLSLLLFQALIFSNQLTHPLGAFDWTDKQVFFDILIFAHAGLVCRIFCRTSPVTVFYLLAVIFNANYFFAGVQKLQLSPGGIEWITQNQVVNLVLAAYHNGWLRMFDQATFVDLLISIQSVSMLLTIPTMLIEVGSILMLLRPSVFRALMLLHVLLHLAIVVCSGVFFWKWCVLNLVFYALVRGAEQGPLSALFSRRAFYFSMPLFLLSPVLFAPAPLGWFDTPYVNIIRPYSVDEHGSESEIEGFYFGPYNMLFQQSRFYFLSPVESLVGTYGGTEDYYLSRKLEQGLSSTEALMLRQQFGRRLYSESEAARFEEFLLKYIANRNKAHLAGMERRLPGALTAPYHIYSYAVGSRFDQQSVISKLSIRSLTYYREELIEDKLLLEVDIPEGGA